MARYKVLADAYIGNQFVRPGDEVEYAGKVRPGIDIHLELIEDKANLSKAKTDTNKVDDDTRAEAIKLKLTEDGKPEGKPIDADTPIDVVEKQLAAAKQANTNA